MTANFPSKRFPLYANLVDTTGNPIGVTGNPLVTGAGAMGGNAEPSDVLQSKTFTNDDGQQTGTVVDKTDSSDPCQWGNNTSSTEIAITVPEGFYPGGQQNLRANDINLLAANIKAGVTIFGVTGTYTGP